ncbi:hypothetical protein B4N89_02890 [Embleya scabrispora]|uniref:DUF742 domain-containing protein n=1 Tax=Embleya scabrispora TaxID=159449 RepID=A0A1T3NTD7_9ACTN|nr:DUF742 domain-containing protein [Embleya scabrispora]OPC80034.1 hypothetical protein B4N89_02890 [Embleya scabrispora]
MRSGWDQSWDEDASPVVRPYTLTRGRTKAVRDADLTLITLVTTVDPDEPAVRAPGPDESSPGPRRKPRDGRGRQPEHQRILELCREPQAVAEVAALIDLPVSITKVLVDDLLRDGLVTVRAPLALARTPDTALLKKVRDGLLRL